MSFSYSLYRAILLLRSKILTCGSVKISFYHGIQMCTSRKRKGKLIGWEYNLAWIEDNVNVKEQKN